jgi:hypothetical protein
LVRRNLSDVSIQKISSNLEPSRKLGFEGSVVVGNPNFSFRIKKEHFLDRQLEPVPVEYALYISSKERILL